MRNEGVALYETPILYDAVVRQGPCGGFYRRLAQGAGGPVLELACGTGRLSIPIAEDGHDLVALDISDPMLKAARRKAEAARVVIEFVEADMRSFDLGRRFALVIVSCNSLAHLTTNEELIGALRRIVGHLAPDGLLAFDVVNPRIADLACLGPRSERGEEVALRSHATAREELLAYDPVSQIRVLQWEIVGRRTERRRTEAMSLRTIFPQELPLLLSAAGLELVARFGDFEERPFVADSLNQVCIARPIRGAACSKLQPSGSASRARFARRPML
jgi:SAM-dependent methyltransferase